MWTTNSTVGCTRRWSMVNPLRLGVGWSGQGDLASSRHLIPSKTFRNPQTSLVSVGHTSGNISLTASKVCGLVAGQWRLCWKDVEKRTISWGLKDFERGADYQTRVNSARRIARIRYIIRPIRYISDPGRSRTSTFRACQACAHIPCLSSMCAPQRGWQLAKTTPYPDGNWVLTTGNLSSFLHIIGGAVNGKVDGV